MYLLARSHRSRKILYLFTVISILLTGEINNDSIQAFLLVTIYSL